MCHAQRSQKARDTSAQLLTLAAAKLSWDSSPVSPFSCHNSWESSNPAVGSHTLHSIKKGSQKLQGTDGHSQQVTNTALGLFLFSTETRLSRFLTQGLLKWAETCSKKSSRGTVFVSYRVHNKLLSTCHRPTKSYIQCKKIQYFLLVFLF